ncbi:MAG: carboxypeptidase M32 [Planctomycetota bacterium]|nr:carboxypeptidase M32 [Planctomycetota bacterium]
MPEHPEVLEKLIASSRETMLLMSTEELLNWDQRTMMPAGAAEYRAEQITLLSGMIHQRLTDPQRGEWLEQLAEDSSIRPESDAGVIVSRLTRQYNKEKKVPRDLVEELSRTRVLAHESWVLAREKNDFSLFSGHLKTIVRLLREKTEAIGFEDSAYDVLLDDYEPDARTREIENVFTSLREALVPLIEKVVGSSRQPDHQITSRRFDVDAQRKVGMEAARLIGFDFNAGRLDVTHHPFCCTLGPNDCRLTTRYSENHFNSAFFGTMHEAGHGLYEQGLRKDQFGLPTGEYCSLGIHESQSRLWENMVGRSLAFWEFYFPRIQSVFPSALQDVSVESFFGAVNLVQPSLIRVEADEATYSLHIIIRFELEQEIFSGQFEVEDLPEAWREKYRKYLGVFSEGDDNGVLQDVHWSEALFGYFPTYALGNLYAAQLFQAADASLGGLDSLIREGEFGPLLEWLRRHVHRQGKSSTAAEIVENSTGNPLSCEPMIDYLESKYSLVYGFSV